MHACTFICQPFHPHCPWTMAVRSRIPPRLIMELLPDEREKKNSPGDDCIKAVPLHLAVCWCFTQWKFFFFVGYQPSSPNADTALLLCARTSLASALSLSFQVAHGQPTTVKHAPWTPRCLEGSRTLTMTRFLAFFFLLSRLQGASGYSSDPSDGGSLSDTCP